MSRRRRAWAELWQLFMYWLSRCFIWLFCKFWFRLGRRGVALFPRQGPVLVAANHGSYLDPLLLGSTVPRRIRFVARGNLGKVPLVGGWMRAVGVIFVPEGSNVRQAMERSIAELANGKVVAIFPEGSRTQTGEVESFQRGLLLLLKKSGATVVPAGIRGSFHAFPPGRTLPRPWRCTVHYGAPMAAAEVLAEGGLEILRQRVSELSDLPLAAVEGARE